MKIKKILMVSGMLLSIGFLNAMEQPHGLKRERDSQEELAVVEKKQRTDMPIDTLSKTTKELERNLGDLQRLPDDVIVQILLNTINWDSPVDHPDENGLAIFFLEQSYQEARSSLANLCLTNKSLYDLIHNQNQKKLRDRCDRLKLESKLIRYSKEKGKDKYTFRYTLHNAAINFDYEFLNVVLPELLRLNMTEEFVNKPSKHGWNVLESVLSTFLSPYANYVDCSKDKEIIDIFLNNGARFSSYYLWDAITKKKYELARLLLKHSTCADIKKAYSWRCNFHEVPHVKPFIRENHKCSECKFE